MPQPRTQDILMRSNSGKENKAILHTTLYDQPDALKRALKMAGLFLVLAFVTLFIPLAHFVLVPSFLIASVVVPLSVYKIREAYERAEGECPTCGKEVAIKLDAKDRLPLWRYCPECDNSVQLILTAGAAKETGVAEGA